MAQVNATKVCVVRFGYQVHDIECSQVFFYTEQQEGSYFLPDPQPLGVDFYNIIGAALIDCLSANVQVSYVEVDSVKPGLAVPYNDPLGGVFGSAGGGDAAPSNIAAMGILGQIDVRSTIRRRLYLSGMPESKLQDGVFDSDWFAAFRNFVTLAGSTLGSGGAAYIPLLSTAFGATPGGGLGNRAYYTIAYVQSQNRVAQFRRRQRRKNQTWGDPSSVLAPVDDPTTPLGELQLELT